MLRINGDGKPSPFQALRAISDNRASAGIINAASQPKYKLQGSVCVADRTSRSDDETAWEVTDRACSNLAFLTLFHKPLKLTIHRLSLTGRLNKDRQANFHRREVFFAQLFSSQKKARIFLSESVYSPGAYLSPLVYIFLYFFNG